MSLYSSTCDFDTPFFVKLYNKMVMFSCMPIISNSSDFLEPCVSSRLVASPKSHDEWFCETCDFLVQLSNANHFSDLDYKHCRLFFAECQSIGVFKKAPVGQDLFFTTNNACCTHLEFLSTFQKYEIDPNPFEYGSFSDVYRGIFLQPSQPQPVIIKIFNQHSTATAIYEEYLLLKSFRYILHIARNVLVVMCNMHTRFSITVIVIKKKGCPVPYHYCTINVV